MAVFLFDDETFEIPIQEKIIEQVYDYLRIDVWVYRGEERAPSPAEFHLRKGSQSRFRLVGVQH